MRINKVPDYPIEAELHGRITKVIHEYDGEISIVAVLGILTLIQHEIKGEGDE